MQVPWLLAHFPSSGFLTVRVLTFISDAAPWLRIFSRLLTKFQISRPFRCLCSLPSQHTSSGPQRLHGFPPLRAFPSPWAPFFSLILSLSNSYSLHRSASPLAFSDQPLFWISATNLGPSGGSQWPHHSLLRSELLFPLGMFISSTTLTFE